MTNDETKDDAMNADSNPAAELTEVAWALFWEKVDKDAPNGCWIWLTPIGSHSPFGADSCRTTSKTERRQADDE